MRFLHTADLHLGRQFDGRPLTDDHVHVLEQIQTAIPDEKPDALLIAGDVFDRQTPPETAVSLFNEFLSKIVRDTQTAIVIIAGNHDSGTRLQSFGLFADKKRILIRGPLECDEHPLILDDRHGQVAFSALPFGYEFAAQECFGDTSISTPEHVLTRQIKGAKANVPKGARWVVTAHAFVGNAQSSESERSLTRSVGGVETVAATVFQDCHYVALGHLHRPQSVTGDHITYAGSPIPFSFSEEHGKSMELVELNDKGAVLKRTLPFSLKRQARTLTGTLEELLKLPPSVDFIRAVLTDKSRAIDPMKKLQSVFPNACHLRYAIDDTVAQTRSGPTSKLTDPVNVVREFMTMSRTTPPTEAEDALIAAEVAALETEAA